MPLSDHITCKFPRLDVNLQRVSINVSVDKSLAKSIWTAYYIYFGVLPCFYVHFNMIHTKVIYSGVKKRFIPNANSFFWYVLHKVILRCYVLISTFYTIS